jgi:hypothetical protein
MSYKDMGDSGWLLFFYSVPSKPVASRVKIWRRLAKAGAVQLKGAVYILPYNEEHLELCQWLISEVIAMKGEGSFVKVDKVETMTDKEIIALFNHQREKDYISIEKRLEELERKINSIRKGGSIQHIRRLTAQFNKHLKEFEDIKKIDFFGSKTGTTLKKKIEILQKEIKGISKPAVKPVPSVVSRDIEDYQNKTWATRKNPFVDRMASAWLIKKFIDKKALFKFIDEKDLEGLGKGFVAFDIRGGVFTHIGDMCTFEVLIKAFGLKDKPLKKIAEIVHELDIKDEKYSSAEAKGIENILLGIRKTAKDDLEAIEKGMAVFEMLYASKQ